MRTSVKALIFLAIFSPLAKADKVSGDLVNLAKLIQVKKTSKMTSEQDTEESVSIKNYDQYLGLVESQKEQPFDASALCPYEMEVTKKSKKSELLLFIPAQVTGQSDLNIEFNKASKGSIKKYLMSALPVEEMDMVDEIDLDTPYSKVSKDTKFKLKKAESSKNKAKLEYEVLGAKLSVAVVASAQLRAKGKLEAELNQNQTEFRIRHSIKSDIKQNWATKIGMSVISKVSDIDEETSNEVLGMEYSVEAECYYKLE